jgi:5-enolpyruvylshikimate-3-phosphate synthase
MRALWPWIEQASKRLSHRNLLAIALANKLARIAWARDSDEAAHLFRV